MSLSQLCYLQDILFSENRTRIPFPSIRASVQKSIFGIRFLGTPGEVGEAVVGRVAVEMAGFHARRTGTDKSFQDQTVNLSMLCPGKISIEITSVVRVALEDSRPLSAALVVVRPGAQAAKRGDVMIGVDGFPYFFGLHKM
jgi:hypothetical protein